MTTDDVAGNAGFRDEEVRFTADDGTTLVGTLTSPQDPGPHPAALLLVGSGPVDRDSDADRLALSITDRIAERLASAGIASLRYDKRGVGLSDGTFLEAGFTENTDDARAGLAHLRRLGGVDGDRLLAIGHSEGALHASLVAADGGVVGAALLAGTARSGEEVLRWQLQALKPTFPLFVRIALKVLPIDLGRRQAKLFAEMRDSEDRVVTSGGRRMNALWYREFLAFDPSSVLADVEVPVLALTGAKDLQSPPEDVDRIRDLVAGPVDARVVPDVNHILRHEPDAPSIRHYKRQVSQPLDPGIMTPLVDWCVATTRVGS